MPQNTQDRSSKSSKFTNDSIVNNRNKATGPIVALGGSAGSFSAFEKFFNHMPADSGMSFIIIMHLDPEHKGKVHELIQNFASIPVKEAEDGALIEPNTVYVIPPNKDLGIHNRKLLLLNAEKKNGLRLPIDYFLQSLAEDQWNKAVGIIFSGMGSDGETGLRMVKEKLGLVMVQDPETAEYDSMPKAAIDTNMVDFVLSPEEMPLKLIQFLNHPILLDDTSEDAIKEVKSINAIQKILMLLRTHTGHDFTHYKKSTITRRIDRRVAYHQLPDYGHYVNYLRENPHETDVLFHELLIGVTKFFRDALAFEALKDKLLPLLQHKKEGEPIRVWVAGCSTGEEAYSIAILLMEYLQTLKIKRTPKVQIFATDLDMDAIEFARTGLYHGNIVADVSEDRIERFFVKKNDSYQVNKELREMIVFAQHNIIKDAPFTRLDLLSCRNVMIYLTTELQKKIIPIFHYSLNPKGILFQGPAETVGGFTDLFSPLESKWKLFERKDGVATVGKMLDFPFQVSKQPVPRTEVNDLAPRSKSLAETFTKILLENYTPASILINEKGDIVYINGKTGRYLELNSGEALMNVYRMAKEELKYVLSNAIHQARATRNEVFIEEVKLKEDQNMRIVNLRVNLLENTPLHGLILVVFEDKGLLKKTQIKKKKAASVQTEAVEELEKELIYTKQQLHTTIEQMETSLEELKSTNEELQSTNEELQSTNEEALTTKEEMQSLNEELMTINIQYQLKAEELTQLNNDMKNMLDNTEIGTIFLDNSLNILRFTPQIKKIFNVIPADVGRSITHIASNFDNVDMESEILKVIERLSVKELEVNTKDGEWFNLRIMPYRTTDNFISGAVLTIHKITHIKQIENERKMLEAYSNKALNSLDRAAVILDKKGCILNLNQAFIKLFSLKGEEHKGISLMELITDESLYKFLQDSLLADSSAAFKHPHGGSKKLSLESSPLINKNNKETLALFIVVEM